MKLNSPQSSSGSEPDVAAIGDDEEYTSLLGHSTHQELMRAPVEKPGPSKLDRLVWVATIIIALCTVIDVVLVLYLGLHSSTTAYSQLEVPEEDLEIRSPYVNLAELYAQTPLKSSKHKPIINHARAFVQIDRTNPHKIFPPYGLMRPIADGMVPEYERRLLLTESISTIAQFRIADFGMEKCSLSITVPAQGESNDVIADEESTIEIYQLPVTKKLNMQKLSYSTRPVGGKLVGALLVSFNNTHSLPEYPCKSGTYQTFEFRCSKPGCKIDVTGKAEAASGLYITQYQTV
ncbi:hypothetical protein MIND_00233200 [Mycena indigotica]|uniref:Ubiquitin 3 binding protein But2 C-terminal domain-containing protein n=1 Tax=Mycena indigotica TaxID=2126181 RepID=A0A8H6T6X9_9AGAR|nr:uncharacterized protein MIND_00233200 [Mycena indigotica]KAF7312203.1 hypothetical protein MIND_00233200 [Mycena indigotica]